MARNISKKNTALFKKQVREILQEFHCTDGGFLGYKWTVETSVGNLHISLHEDLGGIYSIFMMFEDPRAALVRFPCNRYSGKYNIHVLDMETALSWFRSTLERATLANTETA